MTTQDMSALVAELRHHVESRRAGMKLRANGAWDKMLEAADAIAALQARLEKAEAGMMAKTWKQERPGWCPHETCQYRASSQSKLCFGALPAPEIHDGVENTHRMCIRGARDDGEWTFDLQINRGDGYAFYRLLKGLFGFGQAKLQASGKQG